MHVPIGKIFKSLVSSRQYPETNYHYETIVEEQSGSQQQASSQPPFVKSQVQWLKAKQRLYIEL